MKRAQVSLEYTLVIGMIILTLTIAVAVAFYYASSAKGQIRMNQVDKIGKKVSETSDSIYYLGVPSKATIELIMPDQVKNALLVRAQDPTSTTRDYIEFIYYGSGGDATAIYYIKGRFDSTSEINQSGFLAAGLKRLTITAVNENNQARVNLSTGY
jgi:uncharacterized protein (UPF0333 family)